MREKPYRSGVELNISSLLALVVLVVSILFSTSWAFAILPPTQPPSSPQGNLRPEKVHVAGSKKNENYIQDGLITGGDQAIDDVVVKDIRRAPKDGFERVVIDLEGVKKGEPAAIGRPPYYQIALSPEERRMILTIWGRPKLSFDSKKIMAAFKHSSTIQNVVLLPRLEEDSWTFSFELKGLASAEVFELSNPVRVIVDIQPKRK